MWKLFSVFLLTNDWQLDSSPSTTMNFKGISNRVALQCTKQTPFSPVFPDKSTPSTGAFPKWSAKQQGKTANHYLILFSSSKYWEFGTGKSRNASGDKKLWRKFEVKQSYCFTGRHWKGGKIESYCKSQVFQHVKSLSSNSWATQGFYLLNVFWAPQLFLIMPSPTAHQYRLYSPSPASCARCDLRLQKTW